MDNFNADFISAADIFGLPISSVFITPYQSSPLLLIPVTTAILRFANLPVAKCRYQLFPSSNLCHVAVCDRLVTNRHEVSYMSQNKVEKRLYNSIVYFKYSVRA